MPNRQAPDIPAVEHAVSVLANTMRRYIEAFYQLGTLFDVDREEAITNLDRAFEAKLNAFHSLYDVSRTLFPYFDHGDTATLIAVRNALHHHDNPLFHSMLARLHLEEGLARWEGAAFLIASYATRHGAPVMASHAIRLDDLDARLNPALRSPYFDAFTSQARAQARFDMIDRDLSLGVIRQQAMEERYPAKQVYLDIMPVFVSAVCRVFKALAAAGVRFIGDDAQTYLRPFTTEFDVDLQAVTFKMIRIG